MAEVTSRQGERDVVVAKRLSLPSVDLAGPRAFNDDRLQFMWRFFQWFSKHFFCWGRWGGGVVLTVAVHSTHPTWVMHKTTVLTENFPMMPLSVNCGLFEWAQKAGSPVCGLSLVNRHRVAFSRGGGGWAGLSPIGPSEQLLAVAWFSQEAVLSGR